MKIWSLPKQENVTAGKKYRQKREEIAPKISPLFHNIFNISLTSKSPVTHIFVKCGCSNYFFLNSATLICRGTDISKYFRESLGIRDNESRLYLCRSVRKHVFWQVCPTRTQTNLRNLGPVLQSVVSLTSSLRVISLTVLVGSIHNILIFLLKKMWVAFALQKLLTFFQQKDSAYLRMTRCKF